MDDWRRPSILIFSFSFLKKNLEILLTLVSRMLAKNSSVQLFSILLVTYLFDELQLPMHDHVDQLPCHICRPKKHPLLALLVLHLLQLLVCIVYLHLQHKDAMKLDLPPMVVGDFATHCMEIHQLKHNK